MVDEDPVRLRMQSGVPIVDVLGEWAPAVTEALTDLIGALAAAGHFEIVVNVKRAWLSDLSGGTAWSSLSRLAESVRLHCGHLDIVGTVEQTNAFLCQPAGKLVRWVRCSTSEFEALGRIKRTRVLTSGPLCTARLRD